VARQQKKRFASAPGAGGRAVPPLRALRCPAFVRAAGCVHRDSEIPYTKGCKRGNAKPERGEAEWQHRPRPRAPSGMSAMLNLRSPNQFSPSDRRVKAWRSPRGTTSNPARIRGMAMHGLKCCTDQRGRARAERVAAHETPRPRELRLQPPSRGR
jgi:hypothetical protein